MGTLVTYFSHTGNTAALGHGIAARLGADEDPILEREQRTGGWGTATGPIQALLGQASSIAEPRNDPANYALVLIGTPVWAVGPAPAVNAWIDTYRDRCKQVAFFATAGGFGATRTFSQMKKRMGTDPIARIAVTDVLLGNAKIHDKLDQFISEINSEKP